MTLRLLTWEDRPAQKALEKLAEIAELTTEVGDLAADLDDRTLDGLVHVLNQAVIRAGSRAVALTRE